MSAQPPPPPPMQVPAQQPHAAGPPSPGPGRKWYVVALVVFALLFVPSLLGFLDGLDGITNGLIRITAPGEETVSLEEGDWTVFYEWAGEIDGRSFTNSTEFPGMEAALFDEAGNEISVTPSTGSFEYDWGGHSGFSVGRVDVPVDGEYTFAAQHLDPANTQEYVLALGKNLGRSTVLLVVGIVGMGVGAFIAFIIWLIVIILRSRAKRRMQMPGYAG